MQTSAGDLEDDELEGWKEISAHADTPIRTLQRRAERAFDPFPVIRRNRRIFARRVEVEAWLERERRRDAPADTRGVVAHRGASSRSTRAHGAATVDRRSRRSPEASMEQAAAARADRERRQTTVVLADEDLEALDELVPMLARRAGDEGAIRPPTRSTALRAALRRGLRQLRDELGGATTETAAGNGAGGPHQE